VPELPAGYAVRPATAEDLDPVVGLFNAYDVWDFGRTDTVREHLEADWVAPGFDPAADTWLVTEGGGGVVGFAYVQACPPRRPGKPSAGCTPDTTGAGSGRS
jgi:hypothetical protein